MTIKYTVIEAESMGSLIDLVNEAMAVGWVPHGGVAASYEWISAPRDYPTDGWRNDHFAQAMILKAKVTRGETDAIPAGADEA